MNGREYRVVVAENRTLGLVLRKHIQRRWLPRWCCLSAWRVLQGQRHGRRRLRSGQRPIKARAWRVLSKLRLQREQAAEQATAIRKLLRIGVVVEQAYQTTAIFREASVAAR